MPNIFGDFFGFNPFARCVCVLFPVEFIQIPLLILFQSMIFFWKFVFLFVVVVQLVHSFVVPWIGLAVNRPNFIE